MSKETAKSRDNTLSSTGPAIRNAPDLTESGVAYRLIDSVQFHIDGLCSKPANSVSVRRCSVWALVNLLRDQECLQLLRNNGVALRMLGLLQMLPTEVDREIRLGLLSLALLISRKEDGSIEDLGSAPPEILAIFLNHWMRICSMEISPASSQTPSVQSRESASVIHKKRKMFAKSPPPTPSPSGEVESSSIAIAGDAGCCPQFEQIFRQLANLLVAGDRVHLEASICLTLCNRLFVGATSALASQRCGEPRAEDCEEHEEGEEEEDGNDSSGVDRELRCWKVKAAVFRESLGRFRVYQRFLSAPESDCNRPLLSRISVATCALLQNVINDFQQRNPSCSLEKRLKSSVWHALGLLEAACFDFQGNQNLVLQSTVQGNGERNSLLHLLLETASCLARQIEASLASLQSNYLNQSPKQLRGRSRPFTSPESSMLRLETVKNIDVGQEVDSTAMLKRLYPELTAFESVEGTWPRITTSDLFLGSLKLCVNLSSGSAQAADQFLCQNANSEESYLVDSVIDMLKKSFEWRVSVRAMRTDASSSPRHQDSSSAADATAPTSSDYEKTVFDTMLYLITLLSNLIEMKPSQVASRLLTRELSGETITGAALIRDVLLFESRSFVDEMLKSDEVFTLNRQARAAPDDKSSQLESEEVVCSPSNAAPEPTEEALPISELILSSHCSLLLHSMFCSNSGALDGKHSESVRLLIERLPRANWWLPMRTLKAFVALQSKSGVFLSDSLVPILKAVEQLETLVYGEIMTVGDVASRSVNEGHSIAPNRTSQRQSTSKWKWNGTDFVWEDEPFDDAKGEVGKSELTGMTSSKSAVLSLFEQEKSRGRTTPLQFRHSSPPTSQRSNASTSASNSQSTRECASKPVGSPTESSCHEGRHPNHKTKNESTPPPSAGKRKRRLFSRDVESKCAPAKSSGEYDPFEFH